MPLAYLRNTWYMAAWASDLPAGGRLARTLLGEPLLLFRDEGGAACALLDRCPHRFAPLSLGSIENGVVACPYHGLRFGADGRCVHNPHGRITRSMSARRYPVVEQDRILWVWMGDAAVADPAAIRPLPFLSTAPDTAFSSGYLLGQGHYQLFVDNILDLSHTDYLHPDTLGGGSITRTKAQVSEPDGGGVHIAWRSFDEVPTPLLAQRFPPGQRVDAWTEVSWSAPGVMSLVNGAVPAGTPREQGGNALNVHIMTPQDEQTTHYFFGATRDYAQEDGELNERMRRVREAIFTGEDEPMIRAQSERMAGREFWSMRPVLLKIDDGAVRARRKMEALIKAEVQAGAQVEGDAPQTHEELRP